MGCYDEIKVPCPACGEIYWAQSKSGECEFAQYELNTAPEEVLVDVNRHAPFGCICGARFQVVFVPIPMLLSFDPKEEQR